MSRHWPHASLIALSLAICGIARAQQSVNSSDLHFEAVSIRESKPNPDGSYSMRYGSNPHNSHLEMMNLGSADLLREAFGIRPFQIEGVTGLPPAMYTIHASSSEETDSLLKAMTDQQALQIRRKMLQEILVERFHLQYHFITKEMPSYLLLAEKRTKLRSSTVKPLSSGVLPRGDDPASPWITWHCGHPGCSIDARGQTMQELADLFIDYMQAPIVDRTNLPGLWDFHLQWWVPMMSGSGAPNDDSYPEPEAAFPEQLGLKLERGKSPMQILVVDRMEPPTPN